MKKDRNYLINMYNATSTDDGNGDIETYESWLEGQLLNRLEKENESNTVNVPVHVLSEVQILEVELVELKTENEAIYKVLQRWIERKEAAEKELLELRLKNATNLI